jgi:hypothetical protein
MSPMTWCWEVWDFPRIKKKRLRAEELPPISKTLSQLRVEEAKTLPLDDYQAMLNIGQLA